MTNAGSYRAIESLAKLATQQRDWEQAKEQWRIIAESFPERRKNALIQLKRAKRMHKWSILCDEFRSSFDPHFIPRLLNGTDWVVVRTHSLEGGINSVRLHVHHCESPTSGATAVVEKVPSPINSTRITLNDREIYLYEHLLPELPTFAPALYGRRSFGNIHFLFFPYVDGRRGDARRREDWRSLVHSLTQIGCVAIDWDQVRRAGYPLTASTAMAVDRLEKIISRLNYKNSITLQRFVDRYNHIVEAFNSLPTVLGHGDLHFGNVVIRQTDAVLLDWTRWGLLPVGADLGKYCIGLYPGKIGDFRADIVTPYSAGLGQHSDYVMLVARHARVVYLLARASRLDAKGKHMKEILDHMDFLAQEVR